jgi:hypothetical protein
MFYLSFIKMWNLIFIHNLSYNFMKMKAICDIRHSMLQLLISFWVYNYGYFFITFCILIFSFWYSVFKNNLKYIKIIFFLSCFLYWYIKII